MPIILPIPKVQSHHGVQPFGSAEEAWFWFMQPSRVSAGVARPCVPHDMLKLVERLYRTKRLSIDHIKVLRHYGSQSRRPHPSRFQERRAHVVWNDAMTRLDEAMEHAGWIGPRLQRAVIDLSLERVLKASVHS